MSNTTASCEWCNRVVSWDDADDYWHLTEAGWECDTCQEANYQEGMRMAAEYVRTQASMSNGCPRCGSQAYDEHMICHSCMVDDTDC